VPTVAICTQPFRVTAQAIAASYGVPAFELALTAHPVASLSEEELRQRADELVPRVLEILGVEHRD
jgi:hypothetical protein